MSASTPIEPKEGFQFGADPEVFVFYKNEPVSAAGLIPGTKEEPYLVEDGAVQVDGMAAEFNINPAKTFQEFNKNIGSVMKQLEAMLPKGHELRVVPSVNFSYDAMNVAPDEAKVLGCNPDYNAWTGEINPPPSDPEDPFMRCAAGHIHIGWTEGAELTDAQHTMNCRDLVKQLDWYLGGWSIRTDSDPTRRKLYGRAGAYRPKTYGVEYRVLSNFWITTRERRLAVWNRLQTAIRDMSTTYMPDLYGSSNPSLVEAINTTSVNKSLENVCRYPLFTLNPY